MERYLMQNSKYLVFAGSSSCEQSSADIVSPWDESKDWNDRNSPQFFKFLERTNPYLKKK